MPPMLEVHVRMHVGFGVWPWVGVGAPEPSPDPRYHRPYTGNLIWLLSRAIPEKMRGSGPGFKRPPNTMIE